MVETVGPDVGRQGLAEVVNNHTEAVGLFEGTDGLLGDGVEVLHDSSIAVLTTFLTNLAKNYGRNGNKISHVCCGREPRYRLNYPRAAWLGIENTTPSAQGALAMEFRLLTKEQRHRFDEDGFLVVKGALNSEECGRLIEAGYVQALLSGNALAVHDVERALYGTSLGVDQRTGIPVHEGHMNHMRAINAINKCGSLREAVEQGVLRDGVMVHCIRAGVPFVLAGSIRDDGPLPDTIMDLLEAQARTAEHIAGAEMELILASMLHGIGVGNMTPSWVKTVCVDINPAVVTKLVDRGSAQAVGIVTDVGLFLRLLADALVPR
jgi:hypothetical protein